MEATISEERSEFGDEVERERAREIAAERGRKRGSGKKTEAQDKVNGAFIPLELRSLATAPTYRAQIS